MEFQNANKAEEPNKFNNLVVFLNGQTIVNRLHDRRAIGCKAGTPKAQSRAMAAARFAAVRVSGSSRWKTCLC
jgi:hypothetical protein